MDNLYEGHNLVAIIFCIGELPVNDGWLRFRYFLLWLLCWCCSSVGCLWADGADFSMFGLCVRWMWVRSMGGMVVRVGRGCWWVRLSRVGWLSLFRSRRRLWIGAGLECWRRTGWGVWGDGWGWCGWGHCLIGLFLV